MPRPRWTLQAEAVMWRNLMDIGMRLHCLASPSAPAPSFTQVIPSTIASVKGNIPLQFYVPESYTKGGTPNSRRGNKDASQPTSYLYPIVINFHGGGFTIGKATDDARWARAVVEYTEAVVVSVDYRLAPEHPFPIAIEDGVDATLYLIEHAEELRLDRDRIAFSGFSAGGNMAFSVPIRLQEEYRLRGWVRDEENDSGDKESVTAKMEGLSVSVSDKSSSNSSATTSSITSGTSTSTLTPPLGTVVAISSWYPSIDYSNSREERRKSNVRSDKELPKFFTDLFDASYLHPPTSVDVRSPWLSPGIAPARMIKELPENIVIYACEWDALCAETVRFYERLVGEEFLVEEEEEKGKELDEVVLNSVDRTGNGNGGSGSGSDSDSNAPKRKSRFKVVFKKVMGACHAFDKTPNPFNWDPKIETMYRDACKEMREVFYGAVGDEEVRRVRAEEQKQGQHGEGGQKGSVTPRVEVTRLPHSDESLARVGSE